MSIELSRDERETAFTQSAEDRADGVWHVYSDDPYWLRRLERVGKLVRADGPGKWFTIEQSQLRLFRPASPSKPRPRPAFLARKGHNTASDTQSARMPVKTSVVAGLENSNDEIEKDA